MSGSLENIPLDIWTNLAFTAFYNFYALPEREDVDIRAVLNCSALSLPVRRVKEDEIKKQDTLPACQATPRELEFLFILWYLSSGKEPNTQESEREMVVQFHVCVWHCGCVTLWLKTAVKASCHWFRNMFPILVCGLFSSQSAGNISFQCFSHFKWLCNSDNSEQSPWLMRLWTEEGLLDHNRCSVSMSPHVQGPLQMGDLLS